MNRKGIIITILCVVLALIGAAMVITGKGSNATGIPQDETASTDVASSTLPALADESGAELKTADGPAAEVQVLPPGKTIAGSADAQAGGSVKEEEKLISGVIGEGNAAIEAVSSSKESLLLGNEAGEIELPMEVVIPEDWDWKDLSEAQEGSRNETEHSLEESSKTDEEGSQKEGTTEQSGEETSPVESGSEEQSSEEAGTEETESETETETTTLSPEEQASIVESATAPIELPPIFFN